ncbi:MAG: hypothetical protein NVSMB5_05520 [Candidatus Velthaea sp.]
MHEASVDELLSTKSFLVDTNIISHVINPKREINAGIGRFLEIVDEDRLFLSSITVGEIQKGIDLIRWSTDESGLNARRRIQADFEERLEELCDRFKGRIIVTDVRVARQWGRFHAERQRVGKKTPVVDTLIAACAHSQHLVVATADSDFDSFADTLTIYNPMTHTVSGYRHTT